MAPAASPSPGSVAVHPAGASSSRPKEGLPPGQGGVRAMMAEGVLEDDPVPRAIFGLHSFADMEVGKVGFSVGPALAALDHFEIRGAPATINAPALAAQMLPTLRRVLGGENVLDLEPAMGGEDFAYFANEVAGLFFRLGQSKPGGRSGGRHTPDFPAGNSAVPVGIHAMTACSWTT